METGAAGKDWDGGLNRPDAWRIQAASDDRRAAGSRSCLGAVEDSRDLPDQSMAHSDLSGQVAAEPTVSAPHRARSSVPTERIHMASAAMLGQFGRRSLRRGFTEPSCRRRRQLLPLSPLFLQSPRGPRPPHLRFGVPRTGPISSSTHRPPTMVPRASSYRYLDEDCRRTRYAETREVSSKHVPLRVDDDYRF